jgi:hypothetical protein
MSNREWRCVKALIPITSSLWQLLVAEEEYERLLVAVIERVYDRPTLDWLVSMIRMWPVQVCVSPEALLAWYRHLTDLVDVPSYSANLRRAAELRVQMEAIRAKRNKDMGRLAKSLQKEIKQYQKLKAAQEKAKRQRKKLRGRR